MRRPYVLVKNESEKLNESNFFLCHDYSANNPETLHTILSEYLVLVFGRENLLLSLRKISTSKCGNRAFGQNRTF